MHDTLKNVERKVIPRWRRVVDTPREELAGSRSKKLFPINISAEVEDVLTTFSESGSVEHAIEAIYLKDLIVDKSKLQLAATRVLAHRGLPSSLYAIARSIFQDGGIASVPSARPEPHQLIRQYRIALRENPRNALAHVELARSFASLGYGEKAEQHFHVALKLAPNNRFVLRAAGRFFVHQKQEDKAVRAMREAAKYDPWVTAASLSISHLAELPMPRTREVLAFIEKVGDPRETSELSAAIATAELEAGNLKRAKKLFRDSATAATDNVVAQLEWASTNHGITFDEKLLETDLAFEARAARLRRSQEWHKVVEACDLWLDDEPFSVRPVFEASFVASELLQDNQLAKSFVERGLVANPDDPGLLNNLAYNLIMLEDTAQASKVIAQARKLHPDGESVIALDATEGLLSYRTGSADAGAALYHQAIVRANEQKLTRTKLLAFMHFAYEEIRRGGCFEEAELKKIKAVYESSRTDRDIRAMYDTYLAPMIAAHEVVQSGMNSLLLGSLNMFANEEIGNSLPTSSIPPLV